MLSVAEIIGVIGIVFLFVYRFTGSKGYARSGQACLIVSFGVIAFMLIAMGNFWVGGAFAVAAAIQLYSVVINILKSSKKLNLRYARNSSKYQCVRTTSGVAQTGIGGKLRTDGM